MKTTLWEVLAGSIVLGWVFHLIPANKAKDRHAALTYAFGFVFCGGSILMDMAFGRLWIAVLAPFGVMVPALCLQWSARKIGFALPRAPRLDLLALVALMLVVTLGAGGVLPIQPYAWFYSGLGAGVLALGIAAWALWRNQAFVLGAVVLGQVLWLLDVGSSNFYDHMTHFVLIPALAVVGLSPKGSANPMRSAPTGR